MDDVHRRYLEVVLSTAREMDRFARETELEFLHIRTKGGVANVTYDEGKTTIMFPIAGTTTTIDELANRLAEE